jgi:hypothetical protein
LPRNDFHSFPTLRQFFGDRRFKSDEEVKDVVWVWLHGLAAVGYDEGTKKLFTGYGKSLNFAGDYI